MALVSRRASYGLRAMYRLAEKAEQNNGATIAWLAEDGKLPRKYLEQIIRDLRRARLIDSKPGPGGGCRLSRPAREISIGDIVYALDGELMPSHCFEHGFDDEGEDCPGCWGVETCAMRELWSDLRRKIDEALGDVKLSDLMSRQHALLQPE